MKTYTEKAEVIRMYKKTISEMMKTPEAAISFVDKDSGKIGRNINSALTAMGVPRGPPPAPSYDSDDLVYRDFASRLYCPYCDLRIKTWAKWDSYSKRHTATAKHRRNADARYKEQVLTKTTMSELDLAEGSRDGSPVKFLTVRGGFGNIGKMKNGALMHQPIGRGCWHKVGCCDKCDKVEVQLDNGVN